MHPSAKLFVVVAYSICSVILTTIRFNGYPLLIIPWFLVLLGLVAATGIFKKFLKTLGVMFFLAALILVIQTFFVPDADVLWQWMFIKVYRKGLIRGITLAFVILNIAGILGWLFQSTSNKELAQALEDGGLSPKATFIFLSSLQMVSVLSESSRTIMNAQRARGVETDGNLLVRAKAFIPSLIPLILSAIAGSEERVLTLEAKGFNVACKKTHLFELQHTGCEKSAKIISTVVLILVVIGRILVWLR